ncbi:hypothetical protein V1477_021254 [Vespula maculifrons]|uniref:Uncharacterized protein n=1 Tax=Vespula maculifrons TaxID=7453 RepID=A0ABD2AGV3_VESMC
MSLNFPNYRNKIIVFIIQYKSGMEVARRNGVIVAVDNEFKCIQRARLTLDMATLKYATVPISRSAAKYCRDLGHNQEFDEFDPFGFYGGREGLRNKGGFVIMVFLDFKVIFMGSLLKGCIIRVASFCDINIKPRQTGILQLLQ